MRRFFAPFFVLLFAGAQAQAQELVAEYYTLLEPVDAFNSRGAPLDDFCAIVQQDRANWHRFGKAGPSDQADWFFTTSDRRAMITGNCDYDRGYFANPGQRIRSGQRSFYVYVRAFGKGGVVSRVVIVEGAG